MRRFFPIHVFNTMCSVGFCAYETTAFPTQEVRPGLCSEVKTQKVGRFSSLQQHVCVGVSKIPITCPVPRQRARQCVSWKVDYAWAQRYAKKIPRRMLGETASIFLAQPSKMKYKYHWNSHKDYIVVLKIIKQLDTQIVWTVKEKKYEQTELAAKLLDYFLWSNKSNMYQDYRTNSRGFWLLQDWFLRKCVHTCYNTCHYHPIHKTPNWFGRTQM